MWLQIPGITDKAYAWGGAWDDRPVADPHQGSGNFLHCPQEDGSSGNKGGSGKSSSSKSDSDKSVTEAKSQEEKVNSDASKDSNPEGDDPDEIRTPVAMDVSISRHSSDVLQSIRSGSFSKSGVEAISRLEIATELGMIGRGEAMLGSPGGGQSGNGYGTDVENVERERQEWLREHTRRTRPVGRSKQPGEGGGPDELRIPVSNGTMSNPMGFAAYPGIGGGGEPDPSNPGPTASPIASQVVGSTSAPSSASGGATMANPMGFAAYPTPDGNGGGHTGPQY